MVKNEEIDPVAQKRFELLQEEIKTVTSAILSKDERSNQIKTMCLTIWLATWSVITFEHIYDDASRALLSWLLPLCSFIIPTMFLVMERINQLNKAKYLKRAKQLQLFINSEQFDEAIKFNDWGNFIIFDPAAGSTKRDTEDFPGWWEFLWYPHDYGSENPDYRRQWGIRPFYVTLYIVSVIGFIVLSFSNLSESSSPDEVDTIRVKIVETQ